MSMKHIDQHLNGVDWFHRIFEIALLAILPNWRNFLIGKIESFYISLNSLRLHEFLEVESVVLNFCFD